MNEDFSMRLQAYLDGELGAAERAQVESVLAQDPEARALERELRMVMSALRDADPVVSVPESREFYWSRIERAINASEAVAARQARPESTFAGWFRRALLPLSGVAAACFMLFMGLRETGLPVSMHGETESPLAETGALTFRSEAERVTVVWLYDKDQASEESDTERVN